MRIGIFISSFVKFMYGKSLDDMNPKEIEDAITRCVRKMRDLGLNCAEISVLEMETLRRLCKVTSKIEDFYFTIHELGRYGATKLSLIDEDERKEVIDGLKETIDYSSEGNIKVLTVHPASFNPSESGYAYDDIADKYYEPSKAWEISIRLLKELASYASKRDVMLGLENMPRAVLYNNEICKVPHFGVLKNELLSLLSSINNDNLKITFDVGHANTVCQPCDYIREIVNETVHIHLHDNDGRYDQHAPLGTGIVNLHFFFKVLRDEGYSKSIVIERAIDNRIYDDIKILKHYAGRSSD